MNFSEDAFSPTKLRSPNSNNGYAIAGSSAVAGSEDFAGSVDSMRTMFSNSVKVPAGTFREEIHEATSPTTFPIKSKSPVDEIQIKSECVYFWRLDSNIGSKSLN